MPRGWKGNRRPGVALAMRHRLSVVYPLTGLKTSVMEMSTPRYMTLLSLVNNLSSVGVCVTV